jgi:hypothetical protein
LFPWRWPSEWIESLGIKLPGFLIFVSIRIVRNKKLLDKHDTIEKLTSKSPASIGIGRDAIRIAF